MSHEPKAVPPVVCRGLIRAASWIVPMRSRAEWRAKWDASLWSWWILFERGELTGNDCSEIVRYCWSSFTDAFWLRTSREELRRTTQSPGFLLGVTASLLVLLAVATQGFPGTRLLFQPAPLQNTDDLVSIRYTGAANQPFGVPPRLIPLWREKSRMLTDLAAFAHVKWTSHARVTTNFFDVAGASPALGRTFRTGDTDVAILGGAAWKTVYGADPQVIGKTLSLDGREYRIVGVLPEPLWLISRSIQVWTPLTLDPRPDPAVPFLVGAMGRLKPGAEQFKLRNELFSIARSAHQYLPRPPEVAPFRSVPDRPLFLYLFVLFFGMTIGTVLVVTGRPLAARHNSKYWSFLVAKTLALVLIPFLTWIEGGVILRILLPETVFRAFLAGPFLGLLFILTCAFAIRWSYADQRSRCPVCLQRLAMPVTLGSWSSVLEPVTTELMCDAGHGSLYLPETESAESDKWTTLDSSWRDLFKQSK